MYITLISYVQVPVVCISSLVLTLNKDVAWLVFYYFLGFFKAGVPNLILTVYPFSISTEEHLPLKLLASKMLSKITKIYWIFNRTCRFLEL